MCADMRVFACRIGYCVDYERISCQSDSRDHCPSFQAAVEIPLFHGGLSCMVPEEGREVSSQYGDDKSVKILP